MFVRKAVEVELICIDRRRVQFCMYGVPRGNAITYKKQ